MGVLGGQPAAFHLSTKGSPSTLPARTPLQEGMLRLLSKSLEKVRKAQLPYIRSKPSTDDVCKLLDYLTLSKYILRK